MTEDEKIREMCAEREMRESLERQREREYQELQKENERLKKEVEAGRNEGEDKLGTLISKLISLGRTDDVSKAASDKSARAALYAEFEKAMSEAK